MRQLAIVRVRIPKLPNTNLLELVRDIRDHAADSPQAMSGQLLAPRQGSVAAASCMVLWLPDGKTAGQGIFDHCDHLRDADLIVAISVERRAWISPRLVERDADAERELLARA